MLEEYRTVLGHGESEIVEKKSRFLAEVSHIDTEEEALEFIEKIRKKHYNATHHCYAYVLGERFELQRFSDDGEPGGTAGKPMLDVLTGEGIHDTVVVVTRYFGGTLLGTGGWYGHTPGRLRKDCLQVLLLPENTRLNWKSGRNIPDLEKSSIFSHSRGFIFWIYNIQIRSASCALFRMWRRERLRKS